MKTENSSLFKALPAVGIILLLAGCDKKEASLDAGSKEPSICGMPVKQSDGIRLVEGKTTPTIEVVGFPSSFLLNNLEADKAKVCIFELVGPEAQREHIFFRYGLQEAANNKVEVLSQRKLRISYRVSELSYGVISIEPKVAAFENPMEWEQDGLTLNVEGGALLFLENGIPLVRSLGPRTEVVLRNTGKSPRPVELVVDNTSDRLSEPIIQSGDADKVSLTREGLLSLRLKVVLAPGETTGLLLKPRPLRYPFSFLFGGDVKEQLGIFLQLVEKVRLRADPLFMLAVGDYTRNSLPKELSEFFQRTAVFPFPTYYVKGNHEARCQGDVHYPRLFGPERYSLVADQLLFVILDSTIQQKSGYSLGKLQLDWLDKTLGIHRELPWKLVALHATPHPLHGETLPPDYSSNLIPQEAEVLKSIAQKHHVAYVLSGHAHLYARKQESGVVYLTSGGGGAILYNYNPVEGFTINTEKHLVLFHVRLEGVEEEIVTLQNAPAPPEE